VPRVALFDDAAFRAHDAGAGHPERPERLDAVRRGIREAGLESGLRISEARPATDEEILRVHTPEHLALVASTKGRRVRFDPDTAAGPASFAAARRAAGAVVEAVEAVLDGRIDRAFCAVRPPGHHASADRAMGFCLLNNVAVGAAVAVARGLERVAILDFDVHHGNGTQAVFAADPRVLYVSSHQFPFYPGTGARGETGEGEGRGFTVNLPMPAGLGDGEYVRVYREVVEPIGRAFDPELVLVSAGFDAHRADPLAGMAVSAGGFASLMDVCLAVASGAARGRLVAVLEGGYDLDGLAESSATVLSRMMDRPSAVADRTTRPGIDSLLAAYRASHVPHWSVLK
jgi:acetoin utilization deacetylase AcuC-like enzyme